MHLLRRSAVALVVLTAALFSEVEAVPPTERTLVTIPANSHFVNPPNEAMPESVQSTPVHPRARMLVPLTSDTRPSIMRSPITASRPSTPRPLKSLDIREMSVSDYLDQLDSSLLKADQMKEKLDAKKSAQNEAVKQEKEIRDVEKAKEQKKELDEDQNAEEEKNRELSRQDIKKQPKSRTTTEVSIAQEEESNDEEDLMRVLDEQRRGARSKAGKRKGSGKKTKGGAIEDEDDEIEDEDDDAMEEDEDRGQRRSKGNRRNKKNHRHASRRRDEEEEDDEPEEDPEDEELYDDDDDDDDEGWYDEDDEDSIMPLSSVWLQLAASCLALYATVHI